jgi:gamma-glutamyltranspeptidase / glutathione hydrolase
MNGVAGRPAVVTPAGVVASAHPLVSSTGVDVLRSGGNATDAAVAMAAMCYIVLPGQCGVGGDAFAVTYEAARRRYRSWQGSGAGPDGGHPHWYQELGLASIPLQGPLAVAVPGAMACLAALHASDATRSLPELWQPAIDAGERGVAATARTVRDITEHTACLAADAAAAPVFLPGGRAPLVGERLAQPALAATLRRLSEAPGDMYRGELADRCLSALRSMGAPFHGPEWTQTTAVVEPTLTGTYRGLTVHTGTPPSPGYMLLAQAGVLDGILAGLPWLEAEAVHWLAEAAARAFDDRYAHVGSDSPAWRDLLDPAALLRRRGDIAGGSARPSLSAALNAGDTTSFVVVDAAGNAVSFIHSLAHTFGARMMVPGTGVMLNNRLGRGAYLVPGHPNEVRPRRRPMHTLLAWIAAGPDGTVRVVGNTPGGDGQVQWGMQLLSHLTDHGLDAQQALDAPRFTVYPGSDADTVGRPPRLLCEPGLGEPVLAALASQGHPVQVTDPWGAGGGGQLIVCDPETGVRRAGSDPRQDGCAASV